MNNWLLTDAFQHGKAAFRLPFRIPDKQPGQLLDERQGSLGFDFFRRGAG
jgi:hypothetical protein